MTDRITCPTCGTQIAVSETLTAQIRQDVRREFDVKAQHKDAELAKQSEDLRQRERQLEASRCSIEEEIATRISDEHERLVQEAENKAHQAVALEIGDLHGQLTDAKRKLTEAQKAEVQLRYDRRQLEEEKQELELVVTRTLDQERAKIREDARRQADEEHRLQEADKDKLVTDLRRQIDDLKRKSEQGLPQAQGEIMEVHLEDILRHHFPMDTVEPVPASYHGGDVLQHVHDSAGQACGTILWEAKRTKTWNDGWLPKLRDDQRIAKAHLAVLATVEMPKGMSTFGCIDGVWITSRICLIGLAAALRTGLLEVARAKRSLQGTQTKSELLHSYVSGPEFSHRIEGIVEAFMAMREDLESEKRSLTRIWAKREKHLQRALVHTAGLYGDLGGILDANLPQIPNLELATIACDGQAVQLEKAPWE